MSIGVVNMWNKLTVGLYVGGELTHLFCRGGDEALQNLSDTLSLAEVFILL